MILKPEVKGIDSLSAPMYIAIGFLKAAFWEYAGIEFTITSLKEGTHKEGSKHPPGLALDGQTSRLTEEQKHKILAFCKAKLDPLGYDTIIHGPVEHLHCEYDPKPGERLWYWATPPHDITPEEVFE